MNVDDNALVKTVATRLKRKMLERHPMMDEIAIRLNSEPTYDEIQHVRFLWKLFKEVLEKDGKIIVEKRREKEHEC
jgi:hypothetical protein